MFANTGLSKEKRDNEKQLFTDVLKNRCYKLIHVSQNIVF